MTLRDALQKPVIERRGALHGAGQRLRSGASGVADLIAPDGVDRRRSGVMQAGASWMTTLHVRSFPPTLALAWLSDANLGLDTPGITVHQRIVPIPDALARRLLTSSEEAGLGTLAGDVQAGVSLDVDAQQGMEAAAALRRDLASGADRLFQYSIAITVVAPTHEELRARVEAIRLAAARQGVELGVPPFRQWEGYIGAL